MTTTATASTFNSSIFDSKEFDYPLDDDGTEDKSQKRSALKKDGQSRSAQNSSMLLKVTFKEVIIREYGMVLGDNPAVSHGAPVQLEWEPQECHDPVHIDNYEKARSLWRAKDRRGFLLNAHKRVKILFAAGYTIDEIAKATMEMKEYRALRAESLKTQGMMTSAIMALLSGAAETTGTTVRAVTILPNAIAGAGKVMVNGTSKAVVGVGTEMIGLTNRVVNSTANAAKRSSTAVSGGVTEVAKGTGKVVVGTSKFVVKGTTDVVKGTVKGTTDVVKGTGKVMKDTTKVGMDVVKGTGNVMMGGTKSMIKGTGSVVKGTGVLFAGTGKAGFDMMKGTSRRISRLVSNNSSMDSSSHTDRRSSAHFSEDGDVDESERSRNSIGGSRNYNLFPKSRISLPVKSLKPQTSLAVVGTTPFKPTRLTRQRSLDSARDSTNSNNGAAASTVSAELSDELVEMQDFLAQLEGMDKRKAQDLIAQNNLTQEEREELGSASEQTSSQRKKGTMSMVPMTFGNMRAVSDSLGTSSSHSKKSNNNNSLSVSMHNQR